MSGKGCRAKRSVRLGLVTACATLFAGGLAWAQSCEETQGHCLKQCDIQWQRGFGRSLADTLLQRGDPLAGLNLSFDFEQCTEKCNTEYDACVKSRRPTERSGPRATAEATTRSSPNVVRINERTQLTGLSGMVKFNAASPIFGSAGQMQAGKVCSAAAILPRVFLLPAHCVGGEPEHFVWFGNRYIPGRGVTNTEGFEKVRVKKVIVHPKYTGAAKDRSAFDIAIALVDPEDVPRASMGLFSYRYGLASAHRLTRQSGDGLFLVQYGGVANHEPTPQTQGALSHTLMPGGLKSVGAGPVIAMELADGNWRYCPGDTGGTLFLRERGAQASRSLFVAGVLSKVHLADADVPGGCIPLKAIEFTSAVFHRDWIVNTILDELPDMLSLTWEGG